MQHIPEFLIEKKIKSVNRHWRAHKVDEEFALLKKRKFFHLFFPLVTQFDVQRAIVLMGPRRVGKTVMLFQTIHQCLKEEINFMISQKI